MAGENYQMISEAPIDKIITGSQLIESNAEQAIKFIKEGLIAEPVIGEGWYNLGIAYHQHKSKITYRAN